MELTRKVVVITGASSGIGAALARVVHARGGLPVLAARRADRIKALSKQLDGALAVVTDVTDFDQIQMLFDKTLERHGRIDVLVNNAGQGINGPVAQTPLGDLQAIVDVNYIAPAVATRLVAPIMKKQGGGTIINVSSGTTQTSFRIPGYWAYVGTKTALNILSQVSRTELEPDGITVSLIYPFITETEFHDSQIKIGAQAGPPSGMKMDSAETVAERMADMIETGETEVSLLPEGLAAG